MNMMKKNRSQSGFTLIELLVVVAISALMSTLAIIYSHVGQNQVALSVEASKIGQMILQAKELSIATYSQGSTSCAYGVHFDYSAQTYSLFAYNSAVSGGPGGTTCPSIASTTSSGVIKADFIKYSQGSAWQVHPPAGVLILGPSPVISDAITDVLFYPPDPFTIISRDGTNWLPAALTSKVYLKTMNGATAVISVNPAGQVNL
jgi:prepilin-type N-terminal cleavage/methylation domain-containing protein